MVCSERFLVTRLIDGELAPGERRAAAEHLMTCSECASEHAVLLQLKALLIQTPSPTAPAGLAPSVLNRLAREHRPLGVADIWIERRRRAEWASLAVTLTLIWVLLATPLAAISHQLQPVGVKPLVKLSGLVENAERKLDFTLAKANQSIARILGVN